MALHVDFTTPGFDPATLVTMDEIARQAEIAFQEEEEALMLEWNEQESERAYYLETERDNDVYWSGTGELMNDDSYIDYLNSH